MRLVQTMLIWYAYRMDIASFGAGSTLIAPGCIGEAPDKSCYFDEFLRYIQRTGPKVRPWTGSTSVGTKLNPDVLTTANELATSGTAGSPTRYSFTAEPAALFPNKFESLSPSYSAVFGAIVDNIQACRKKVNDQGIDDELDGTRRAIVSTLDARQADQAAKVIKDVNQKLFDAGYTWVRVLYVLHAFYNSSMRFFSFMRIQPVTDSICNQKVETKTTVAPDLSTYTEIDEEGTINAHSAESDALKDYSNSFVANFPNLSKKNMDHALSIQASQALQSRLLGDPSC